MDSKRALEYLLQLVARGYEFPDAVCKVTAKFKLVTSEAITEAYDSHCS